LIGQYYNLSGRVPGSDLDQLLRSPEAKEFLRRAYDPVSPDGPEHFEVVYAKMMTMIDSEPEIGLAALASVSAPALVLQGDRDEVTLEHGGAVAAALGDGRLAVLPGTHGLPIELPGLVNTLLISFLRGSRTCPRIDVAERVANLLTHWRPRFSAQIARNGPRTRRSSER